MKTIRLVGFPLGLAWSRLRHRPGRAVLLALGVAAAAGALSIVLGGSLVAQDVSAGSALAAVPESKRAVAVTYADPSRAAQVLGWRAELDLERMCEDAWRWQRENPAGYG